MHIESETDRAGMWPATSHSIGHRPANVPVINYEWESSIHVKINQLNYEAFVYELEQNDSSTRVPYKIDTILIFKCNYRLSSREIQSKITKSKMHVLASNENDFFFPIYRYQSLETACDMNEFVARLDDDDHILNRQLDAIGPKDAALGKLVVRQITCRYIISTEVDGVSIRESFNKVESDKGVRYYIGLETEYSSNTTTNDVLKYEAVLMKCARKYQHCIRYDEILPKSLILFHVPKLQPFPNMKRPDKFPYTWAYKWNGIKAKLLFDSDQTAIIAPDLHDTRTVKFDITQFDAATAHLLRNMCFQIEIMDDCIVLVELLGALYNGIPFLVEPMTNINFLKMIAERLLNMPSLTLPIHLDGKQLLIQEYYRPPMPIERLEYARHDGFIVAQENQLIKFKQPTIDVRYMGKNVFVCGNDGKIEVNVKMQ